MTHAYAAILALALASAGHAADDASDGPGDADFAASKGASAEAQLRQRLRERIRTLPGSETQYLVGGYAQLDGIATRKKQEGDEQNTFFASAVPFGPSDRDERLSVRQSQFNWLSRTPTDLGPVWTRLQANLFPLDGTTDIDLNQLYLRWDDHLVVGKTYSTFMDDNALPTTLDYNGPGGVTFVRQLLARGSLKLGGGWALEASVEDPQADLTVGGAVLGVETSADRPDLAARVRYESDAGHFQIAGLSRRTVVRARTPLGTPQRIADGSGVNVSGSLALFDEDTLVFQAVTGKGIGRYLNDPLSATGVALDPGGGLELVRTTGTTVYYQRKWAPAWMSVAGASTLWIDTDGVRAPESLRRSVYASANILHRLTPTLIVGAEVLMGEARRVDGETATNVRLQVSVRYLIF